MSKASKQEHRSLFRMGPIMGKLNALRKFLLYGYRYNSAAYIRRMNQLGARIDESVVLYSPETIALDASMPFLLEIGKNVHITAHVDILTHDGVWMAMNGNDGCILGHAAPVKIGNNVFIGRYSMILCGVTICDNVIIGARSLVKSDIEEPGVYAGNPARLVCPYETYRGLRQDRQLEEAYAIAERYYTCCGQMPPQELFADYFWIFAPRDFDKLPPVFRQRMTLGGNLEGSRQAFLASQPDFDGYEAFWNWCYERIRTMTQRKDVGEEESTTCSFP